MQLTYLTTKIAEQGILSDLPDLDNQLGLTNSQSPKVEEQNESKDLEESQSPKEEQDDSSVNDKKKEDE